MTQSGVLSEFNLQTVVHLHTTEDALMRTSEHRKPNMTVSKVFSGFGKEEMREISHIISVGDWNYAIDLQ